MFFSKYLKVVKYESEDVKEQVEGGIDYLTSEPSITSKKCRF